MRRRAKPCGRPPRPTLASRRKSSSPSTSSGRCWRRTSTGPSGRRHTPSGVPDRTHPALVGTTASGKSALALAVGRANPDIEIVSVDSMQVYRGMDIGTAKPSIDDRRRVPHHLVDIADPDEEFTVVRFQHAFTDALTGIEARGHRALLVGGTGLYLRAAVDALAIPGRYPDVIGELERAPTEELHARLAVLDPDAATRMEPSNRR